MRLFRLLLAAGVVVAIPLTSSGDRPAPLQPVASPLPAGKWSVEFANGVLEKVEAKADATVTVSEPSRTSGGKATALAGAILVVFDDDRVERWTAVGRRLVVEHWAPASQFPNGTPVRGIADRAE